LAIKYTNCPQNRPNGNRIYHRLPLQDPTKFTQNYDFWFENIPSGKPACILSYFKATEQHNYKIRFHLIRFLSLNYGRNGSIKPTPAAATAAKAATSGSAAASTSAGRTQALGAGIEIFVPTRGRLLKKRGEFFSAGLQPIL
jgi:hypothetical protein